MTISQGRDGLKKGGFENLLLIVYSGEEWRVYSTAEPEILSTRYRETRKQCLCMAGAGGGQVDIVDMMSHRPDRGWG